MRKKEITENESIDLSIGSNLYTDKEKDLAYVYKLLCSTHPACKVEKDIGKRLKHKYLKLFSKVNDTNDLDYRLLIASLLAVFQDSHTSILFPKSKYIFPINIDFYGGEAYITRIPNNLPNIIGSKIDTINGFTVNELKNKFKEYFGVENDIKLCIIIKGYIQQCDIFRNITDTENKNLRLKIEEQEYEVRQCLFSKVSSLEFYHLDTTHIVTYQNPLPFHYQIISEKSLCYFQFNSMIDKNTIELLDKVTNSKSTTKKIEEHITRSSDIPCFISFLQEMFNDIQKNQIESLLIDLRYNPGGNSLLGNALLKYLIKTKNELFKKRSTLLRISPLFKTTYPLLYNNVDYDELISCDESSLIDKDLLKPFEINPKISFDGDVYFIQSENTYSSAAELACYVSDNKMFKTIGTCSSQKPTCYGDVLFFELPLTRIKGVISSKIFFRPNSEKDNENSLIPDIFIPSTIDDKLNNIDPIWVWIQDNIN